MLLDDVYYDLEVNLDGDVVALGKGRELVFESLHTTLRDEAILQVRYPAGDGDYDWDEDVVKELVNEWLEPEVADWYARGDYTVKDYVKYVLTFVHAGTGFGDYAPGQMFEVGRYETIDEARAYAKTLNRSNGDFLIMLCYEC